MRYHEDIFYPSAKEELIGLLEPIGVNDEHKAFIVPHMALGYIAHLYRAVFSSIPDGTPPKLSPASVSLEPISTVSS